MFLPCFIFWFLCVVPSSVLICPIIKVFLHWFITFLGNAVSFCNVPNCAWLLSSLRAGNILIEVHLFLPDSEAPLHDYSLPRTFATFSQSKISTFTYLHNLIINSPCKRKSNHDPRHTTLANRSILRNCRDRSHFIVRFNWRDGYSVQWVRSEPCSIQDYIHRLHIGAEFGNIGFRFSLFRWPRNERTEDISHSGYSPLQSSTLRASIRQL